MSAKNTAELILTSDNRRLKTSLNSSKREVRSFVSITKNQFKRLGAGIKRSLGSVQGQLGLGVSAVGILAFNKKIIDADEQLTRLAIQGELTKKEMFGLREEMFKNGHEAGKFRSEMASGIDAIVERTGDIEFATKTIEDLGITSQATGAEMGDLGALSSQLNSKFKIGPENLRKGLDVLVGQGKKGAFTLQNLAAQGERLFASAGRLDMTGVDDLRRIGAFAQIARMGTGSSEQATTAVERTLSNILAKQKQIKKAGFDIKDKDGKIKALDDILKGVIKATKGDENILGKMFGEEGIRAVSVLAKSYRETNGFAIFDNLINADFNGTITKDFEQFSESVSFKIKRIMVLGERLGTSLFNNTLSNFGDNLESILGDPKKVEELELAFENFGETLKGLYDYTVLLAKGIGFLLKPVAWVGKHVAKQQRINRSADELRERFNAQTLEQRQEFFAKRGETDIGGIKEFVRSRETNALLSGKNSPINNLSQSNSDGIVKPIITNSIALSVNVDQLGNITDTDITDLPASGTEQQTFLESYFRGN